MKINYEIYGSILNLEFQNDLLLLEHIKNQVGRFIENDDHAETKASFIFIKKKTTELGVQYGRFDFDFKRLVYVEPTQEQAVFGYLNSEKTIVHFYDTYYLVVYSYDDRKVFFYYSPQFYSIDFLLMEFFKYCIFPIKMEEGMFPLHSSCVVSAVSGRALLFVGDSGCGKSSNALFLALKFDYWFCDDEVTYLIDAGDMFQAVTTNDKVKICKAMNDFLAKFNMNLTTAQIEDEYICDVSIMRGKETDLSDSNILKIDTIFFLERDDKVDAIRIYEPGIIEKYRCIIENCNIAVWTNRKHKKEIMKMIDNLIKKVKILSVVYPTNKIDDVSSLIEEKYNEYKN